MKKHPDFKRKNDVKHNLNVCFAVFLTGVDNSSPFGGCRNDEIGVLEPDLRKAYKKYINNYYPEYPSAVVIKKYYEILKRNDFANKQEVNDFLKQYNVYDQNYDAGLSP